MAKRGDTFHQVPTLWHMGFNQPCDVMRKRKGDKKWRRVGYTRLTRSSAFRWWKLAKAGKCIIRRDVTREAWTHALDLNNWKEVR